MTLSVPGPRLLPITILAMSVLLSIKAVSLGRAGAPVRTVPPISGSAVLPTAQASTAATPAASHKSPAASPPSAAPKAIPPPAPSAAGAVSDPIDDAERAVLLELRQRRQELEAREQASLNREAMLEAAERRLAARVQELQALQTRLEALEAGRKDRDEANWRGLVKVYESMRPRDAAAIFNDLDIPVLLQVVDRMKEAKAAPILAAMQPDKARQLTAELAQMRTRTVTPAGSPGIQRQAGS